MNLNNIDAHMHALDVRQQEGGGIEQPVTPMMREQVLNQRGNLIVQSLYDAGMAVYCFLLCLKLEFMFSNKFM